MIDGLIVTKEQWDAKCAEAARMRGALVQAGVDLLDFEYHNNGVDLTVLEITINDALSAPDDGWLARRDAELKAEAHLQKERAQEAWAQFAKVTQERDGLIVALEAIRDNFESSRINQLADWLLRLDHAINDAITYDSRVTHLARIRREAKAQALREAAEHMASMPEAWGAEKAEYFGRLISAELRLLANREEAANG